MSDQVEQTSLMLGDRINWPFILGTATLTFFNVMNQIDATPEARQAAAEAVYYSIPDQWVKADEAFKKEYEECNEEIEVDTRREWCGKKMGAYKFKVEKKINPQRLYHVCVNVFQRRGLLSKTIFTEKIVPQPEDFEDADQPT